MLYAAEHKKVLRENEEKFDRSFSNGNEHTFEVMRVVCLFRSLFLAFIYYQNTRQKLKK